MIGGDPQRRSDDRLGVGMTAIIDRERRTARLVRRTTDDVSPDFVDHRRYGPHRNPTGADGAFQVRWVR